MNRTWRRAAICAAIALASVLITILVSHIQFFQTLSLKAQDANFVLRGKVPTRDIIIIGIDEKAQDHFPEPQLFWRHYYAQAIQAAADGGAKVMMVDAAFAIPVAKWDPDDDSSLAGAYAAATPTMPVVLAWVANTADQHDPAFAVPVNMMASTFGGAAFPNLTDDSDDVMRSQELIEAPEPGAPPGSAMRSLAMHTAEKFLGVEASVRNGKVFLGNLKIPVGSKRDMIINYAGPADTFPKVSLYDVVQAEKAGNKPQLEEVVQRQSRPDGPGREDR